MSKKLETGDTCTRCNEGRIALCSEYIDEGYMDKETFECYL